LTANAAPVLNGQASVFQKVQPKKQAVLADDLLFERLRLLRKELSAQENVPPYIIFSDSTLHEMARLCPTDGESLLAVRGVGAAKLEHYGALFLEIIRNYLQEHGQKIGIEEKRSTPEPFLKGGEEQTGDAQLFEHLRALRKELSAQANVPPYIIFHDSTLHEMARLCPTDEESLLAIKGMGAAKLERYGAQFLKAISAYLQTNGIE
jgi:ATP-dependent DNA helicase RecQ